VNGAESVRAVLSKGLTVIEGPLVPLECLGVLALVIEYVGHVVNGGESVNVVLPMGLLTASEGLLVPLECLGVLFLVIEHNGDVANGVEIASGRFQGSSYGQRGPSGSGLEYSP